MKPTRTSRTGERLSVGGPEPSPGGGSVHGDERRYVTATALLAAGVLHQIPGATGDDPVEPVIVAASAAGAALRVWHCDRRLPALPASGDERADADAVRGVTHEGGSAARLR